MNDLAAIRRDLYALFAGLLADPATADTLALLRLQETAALFGAFDTDGALARLRAASEPSVVGKLRQEFWDLFVVPGRRFVTPSQSVYVDVREVAGQPVGGLMMGDSALGVREAYASAGFEPDDRRTVPPDHVAVELAFMSKLCEQETERPDARKTAAAFLSGNLLRWLPLLRQKVEQNAQTPFYPAVLELLCRYVEQDRLCLEARDGTASV